MSSRRRTFPRNDAELADPEIGTLSFDDVDDRRAEEQERAELRAENYGAEECLEEET